MKAAREAAFLLREMGDTASAVKYAAWADALTDAARQSLTDTKTDTYGDRLQENAMAVYSGAATHAQIGSIAQTVLNPDSDAWDKTGTPPYNNGVITPYSNNYVLYALSLAGRNADALRGLRDCWGGMTAEGATTFREGYDPPWEKTDFHAHLNADDASGYRTSLCHGWSSGATGWLTDRLLGIRPTSGGFKTVEIVPDLAGLSWAEGDVPTPRGLIHERVSMNGTRLTLNVTLPPGVDAAVGIPAGRVIINGKRAALVRAEEGRVYLRLNAPGKYVVQSL